MGGLESGQGELATTPLLLTAGEAAEVLRVGRTTLYALMKVGELRPVHIGRSCRLSCVEIERYVRGLGAPEPAPPRSKAQADDRRPARTFRAGLATAGRRMNPQVAHPSQSPSEVSGMTPRVLLNDAQRMSTGTWVGARGMTRAVDRAPAATREVLGDNFGPIAARSAP